MQYFAYGSNLDTEDMLKFCIKKKLPIPQLKDERPAFLPGYKLVFNYFSATRFCGVANIMPTGLDTDKIYGAVYDVLDPFMKIIDIKEGAPKAYEQRKVEIVLMKGPHLRNVVTYAVAKAHEMEQHVPPSKDYLKLIIKNGKRLGFPTEYLKSLEAIKTT